MNIYQDVLARNSQLGARHGDRDMKLAAVCTWLSELPGYDWVGFYMADSNSASLILGPYVGARTEHTSIPYGEGICGQVAQSLKTYISPDVKKEDNYIACSFEVRSEIVVPVLDEGILIALLDIDSYAPNRFDENEQALLEDICSRLVSLF